MWMSTKKTIWNSYRYNNILDNIFRQTMFATLYLKLPSLRKLTKYKHFYITSFFMWFWYLFIIVYLIFKYKGCVVRILFVINYNEAAPSMCSVCFYLIAFIEENKLPFYSILLACRHLQVIPLGHRVQCFNCITINGKSFGK